MSNSPEQVSHSAASPALPEQEDNHAPMQRSASAPPGPVPTTPVRLDGELTASQIPSPDGGLFLPISSSPSRPESTSSSDSAVEQSEEQVADLPEAEVAGQPTVDTSDVEPTAIPIEDTPISATQSSQVLQSNQGASEEEKSFQQAQTEQEKVPNIFDPDNVEEYKLTEDEEWLKSIMVELEAEASPGTAPRSDREYSVVLDSLIAEWTKQNAAVHKRIAEKKFRAIGVLKSDINIDKPSDKELLASIKVTADIAHSKRIMTPSLPDLPCHERKEVRWLMACYELFSKTNNRKMLYFLAASVLCDPRVIYFERTASNLRVEWRNYPEARSLACKAHHDAKTFGMSRRGSSDLVGVILEEYTGTKLRALRSQVSDDVSNKKAAKAVKRYISQNRQNAAAGDPMTLTTRWEIDNADAEPFDDRTIFGKTPSPTSGDEDYCAYVGGPNRMMKLDPLRKEILAKIATSALMDHYRSGDEADDEKSRKRSRSSDNIAKERKMLKTEKKRRSRERKEAMAEEREAGQRTEEREAAQRTEEGEAAQRTEEGEAAQHTVETETGQRTEETEAGQQEANTTTTTMAEYIEGYDDDSADEFEQQHRGRRRLP